jgi:imidazole glycerol phosphate synthase glutamine amidotransferase subunit
MGWNQLEARRDSRLLRGIAPRSYVYFAHSYYVPVVAEAAAVCTYGLRYTAALEAGNVSGVQFHPEKSGAIGLRIVRNFL